MALKTGQTMGVECDPAHRRLSGSGAQPGEERGNGTQLSGGVGPIWAGE